MLDKTRKKQIEKLAICKIWNFADEFGTVYKNERIGEFFSDMVSESELDYGFNEDEIKYFQMMFAKTADFIWKRAAKIKEDTPDLIRHDL